VEKTQTGIEEATGGEAERGGGMEGLAVEGRKSGKMGGDRRRFTELVPRNIHVLLGTIARSFVKPFQA
jgi:methylglyoxal synthase